MAVLVLIAGPWILVFVAVPLSHYLLWGRSLSREAAEERRLVELAAEFDELLEDRPRQDSEERIRGMTDNVVEGAAFPPPECKHVN